MSGRLGRNDPCACGSGVKLKKCCGRVQDVSLPAVSDELEDMADMMEVMSNTKYWTAEQLAEMEKRLPSCINRETEPKHIPGECGTWVYFGDAIPDDENDYLVTDGQIVCTALWAFDGLHFEFATDDDFEKQVTHWMRYPDPLGRTVANKVA